MAKKIIIGELITDRKEPPLPPALAAHIGNVMLAFSRADYALMILIWQILRINGDDGADLTLGLEMRRRITLVRRLMARHILKTKDLVESVEGGLKQLEDTVEIRNRCAHGIWKPTQDGLLLCLLFRVDAGPGEWMTEHTPLEALASAAHNAQVCVNRFEAARRRLREMPPESW